MNTKSSEKRVNSPLLTPKETADYLRMGVSTLYRYMDERRIPYVVRGKRGRFFRKKDLDAYLERHRVSAVWEGRSTRRKRA